MTKKIIMIVVMILTYISLWSVSFYFAYNATLPYRDNEYFNEQVFPLFKDSQNDEKFLSRYLGTKKAFYSKDKLYEANIKKDQVVDLSLSIYPIYFTDGKKGSFLFIDKFWYRQDDLLRDLTDRTRIDPGYEAYKKKYSAMKVYVQFRYKGNNDYSNPIIVDPFQLYYFLEDDKELEGFRFLNYPEYKAESLLVAFSSFKSELDPNSIVINKRLVPEKLDKKGWPDSDLIKSNNLVVEKPDYSNYNGTTVKVMLLMALLLVIITYLLFFHRIVFNKIRNRYRGKTTL